MSIDNKQFKPQVVSDAGGDMEMEPITETVSINNRTRMLCTK